MKAWIAAIALMAAAAPALADHRSQDNIDQRQSQLEHRIEQGWRSGELTRPEYRGLQDGLRDIARQERYFRADGHLSPYERAELHSRLDRLTHAVYAEKHDGQRARAYYNDGRYAGRRF
jgi:hypothetical protein